MSTPTMESLRPTQGQAISPAAKFADSSTAETRKSSDKENTPSTAVFPWPLLFLVLTALGAVMLRGGYAHYEGQFFLVNYLDARDLFSKIFSAHFNEWDCYQGRELSFLFGWIDAGFSRYSARLGWIHLFSVTHFVGF